VQRNGAEGTGKRKKMVSGHEISTSAFKLFTSNFNICPPHALAASLPYPALRYTRWPLRSRADGTLLFSIGILKSLKSKIQKQISSQKK
jgi:hypothetical protein